MGKPTPPKGLRWSERSLWLNTNNPEVRDFLARLARTRAEAKELTAERDQLDQQVEALLSAVEEHRKGWGAVATAVDRKLHAAADQVRKERGNGN